MIPLILALLAFAALFAIGCQLAGGAISWLVVRLLRLES
jgi:hypothetical protein